MNEWLEYKAEEIRSYGLIPQDELEENEYDDEGDGDESYIIEQIKQDNNLEQYKYIVIRGLCSQCVIDTLIEFKDKLINLESLYTGDMESEECELSWISQSDYANLIKSLPHLKKLVIQGSDGLRLSPINHDKLEHLEIICGGLPKSVLEDIRDSNMPNLKRLIVYMGEERYGFDGDIDSIESMINKDKFPSLEELSLVDSSLQNDIVKVVVNNEILPQLKKISFSYGTLSDKGGKIIIDNVYKLRHLELIDIDWHYMSDEMIAELESLNINIKIRQSQGYNRNSKDYKEEYDDPWDCYPMMTE